MTSREKREVNDRAAKVRQAMAVRGDKSSADLRRRLKTTQGLAYDLWSGKTREPRPDTVRRFRSAYHVDVDFFARPPFKDREDETGETEEPLDDDWPPFMAVGPTDRSGFDTSATMQIWMGSLARSVRQLRLSLGWIERDIMKIFDLPGLESTQPTAEELRWLRQQFRRSRDERLKDDESSSLDDIEGA